MAKKIIVANWKMQPESLAEAQDILESVNGHMESLGNLKDDLSLIFCPPYVYLEEVAKHLEMSHLKDKSFLGAQDIAPEEKGSFTGEVSGAMLKKIGVQYVIIGHSERRWKLGESDQTVNKKIKAALNSELTPIVCIGEKDRQGNFEGFLATQVKNTFDDIDSDQIERCIIAYEPVWAISSNPGAKPDTPDSAVQSINIIKEKLPEAKTYLYGGSVNSNNAKDFLERSEINGVLVGAASVSREEFPKIISLAAKL
jgi:triosephosphate isomerase